MLSAGGALLFTFLLLLSWLWRLMRGLCRWHPAVREVLFLLVSVVLILWGYRGFERVTWYELHLADCSGVRTSPTWHGRRCRRHIWLPAMIGRWGASGLASLPI